MNQTKIPNLFVIGAMKSGTTYLHELISSHPYIFMSKIKEPCFFIDGEELRKYAPQMWNMGFWGNMDKYSKLFGNVHKETIIGESTTLYTNFPTLKGVPKRIFEFNPDARFVYVMRDPVERTISHYWHDVRVTSKIRDVMYSLKNDPNYEYVSYYAMQLNEYLRYFDLDRFYLCTFEKLVQDSEALIRDIYNWLGIDNGVAIAGINQPKNVTPKSMLVLKANIIPYEIRMSTPVRQIMRWVPFSVQKAVGKILSNAIDKSELDMTEAIEYLRGNQIKQTKELEAIIGRSFPEWTTLNP